MTSRRLIIEGLGAALRFLPVAWARTWGALAVVALVLGGSWGLGLWSPHAAWRFGALMVALVATVMAQGGLYRVALGVGAPGPWGFQWGPPEYRLAAVWALTAVFLFVLGLLAFVVILSFAFAVAASGKGFVMSLPMTWASAVDNRGRFVMAAVGALCLFGMIWAAIRVSFAAAATVARGRLQVLASWPTTRGLVWPILIGKCAVGWAPIGFAVLTVSGCFRTALPGPMAQWTFCLAAGGAIAAIWLPLNAGLMTYFYQRNVPS